MLNIAHFYRDFLYSGGMPRETSCLAKAMVDYADHVYIYCYAYNNEQEQKGNGICVRKFPAPKWTQNLNTLFTPKDLKRTLVYLDKVNIVIITGSFIPENYAITKFLKNAGIPYIVSIGAAFNPNLFSGFRGLKKGLYELIFERYIINNALALRLYSPIQKEHLAIRGYREFKSFIAKEGIDWDAITSLGIDRNNIPEEVAVKNFNKDPIFGYLGRIDLLGKGLDLLIVAFSLYKQRGGKGYLRIMGPGNDKDIDNVKRLIQQENLLDIEILPPYSDKRKFDFLRNIDILIHPSRHEGIPRVIREAWAVGCPVMVTPSNNMSDLVERYKAGFNIEPNSHHIFEVMNQYASLSIEEKRILCYRAIEAAKTLEWSIIANGYVKDIRSLLISVP